MNSNKIPALKIKIQYDLFNSQLVVLLFFFVFLDIPAKVSKITVEKREANKLILSWTPGHDGFSLISVCHITVNHLLDMGCAWWCSDLAPLRLGI